MPTPRWLGVRQPLAARQRTLVAAASFILPLLLWAAVSYLPFLWHPYVEITDPGGLPEYPVGTLIDEEALVEENARARTEGKAPASGNLANPIYFPAPHRVAQAMYQAFLTPPRLPSEPWLHESLWHSLQVIFWGFLLSSLVGVPLGIMCGAFPFFARLFEPFIEFFRYLPAPAFGALAVAVLGIYDAPKVAIIFIGTFFQQVLVVSNTTRRLEPSLIEAAQTLGASRRQLLFKVVVPGIIVDLYTDLRILLGWAWTYLMVSELVGTTTGITYFINQQARYRNYPNVYAGIILIGLIGLGSDLLLSRLGRHLFPWQPSASRLTVGRIMRSIIPGRAGRTPAPAGGGNAG
jgi:NitT/TauT family transport system permease protein